MVVVVKQAPNIPVTLSSGNVFTDLGFANPEEELAKAQLASHMRQVIQRERLTEVAAAALLGLDPPKVRDLLDGRLTNFSRDRLYQLVSLLIPNVQR